MPTDEEIDKMIAERAERTKKTVEEIREKTNIPALKRAEAILRSDLAESRLTEEASRHAMHHLWHVMEATSRD